MGTRFRSRARKPSNGAELRYVSLFFQLGFPLFPISCTVLLMNTKRTGAAPRDPENERVGETIQTLRERFGYTQDGLAIETGISRPHLANIEAGRKHLSNRHLAVIADCLGVKPLAIKRPDLELVAA